MNTGIQTELDRVQEALRRDDLTNKEYCELYAVQQALSWATNPDLAASPFETVMNGKVQPPVWENDLPMDTQAG